MDVDAPSWSFPPADNLSVGFDDVAEALQRVTDSTEQNAASWNEVLKVDEIEDAHDPAEFTEPTDSNDFNGATEHIEDVAQEAANAAAAAAQAQANQTLDEQTRWIQQLARDDRDQFSRLVELGVIDADAMPDNQGQHEGEGQQDGEDGEEQGDEDGQAEEGTADTQQVDSNAPDNQDQAAPTTAANVPNTDHFVWLANRMDGREENVFCPACTCEFSADDLLVFLNCGHKWCGECLNSNYRAALQSRSAFPPRCCEIALDHESVQAFLDEDLLIELITKMDEFTDVDPIYCQTPKCTGGYIARNNIKGQWANCTACFKTTCVECKGRGSEHPTPDAHPKLLEKLDEELATKEGWKQCPGCKNMVEKSDGCNFMTCECGHEFCYLCGGTLMNNMPCDCQGQPAWVQQMNAEAAGVNGRGQGDEDEDDEGDEDEERDNEEDEAQEDGAEMPVDRLDGALDHTQQA